MRAYLGQYPTEQRARAICKLEFLAFPYAVAEECSKAARMRVICESEQQEFVEFESVWHLLHDLPDGVKKQQKDRRMLIGVGLPITMSLPLGKLKPETAPLFFDKYAKANDCAVIRIKQQF